MKRLLLIGFLALVSTAAIANGSASNVTITYISTTTTSPGYAMLKFSSNLGGGPSCANGNPAYLAIDISTAVGETQLGIAEAAYMLGKTVTVTGLGTCALTGFETFGSLYITD